jgi:hypothetical protein
LLDLQWLSPPCAGDVRAALQAKSEWRRGQAFGVRPSNDRTAYFREAQTVMFNQYAQWEEEQRLETWTAAEWQQHQWDEHVLRRSVHLTKRSAARRTRAYETVFMSMVLVEAAAATSLSLSLCRCLYFLRCRCLYFHAVAAQCIAAALYFRRHSYTAPLQ